MYVPKNKIRTNLYTEGKEYMFFSTKTQYVGYYHKLYNGKTFTGKTPNDNNVREIVPVPIADGNNFLSSALSISTPSLFPTPQDYKNGEFTRYFIVKRNELIFIEITKKEYEKYKNQDPSVYWRLYRPFSLFWVLTGDMNQVAQTNKNVTELVEQRENVLGLSIYLKEDWTQYYKANP
jgi:hypothetical protein